MRKLLTQLLETAVSDEVFPGCVLGVISGNDTIVVPVGHLTYEEDSPLVTEETIYDVASVTKAIPVSSLALSLIDEGILSLHDQLITVLPELAGGQLAELTVWHLLTHTVGYQVSLSSLKNQGVEAIMAEVFRPELSSALGTTYNYSNGASILLGMVIKRVRQQSLDQAAAEVFFTPLGMKHTTFHPETLPVASLIAPTEDDPWRGRIIRGEVHDESAALLREKMIPGSAGLFSTAPDLVQFLTMLIHKGSSNGRTYFSEEMITTMQQNQVSELGETGALGWQLCQPGFMGRYATEQTIGKTGFTGCAVVCDIPKKKGMVMLSNYHYPTRKKSSVTLNKIRQGIADIIFE